MARGPKNEVTEDSKRIIDICRQLLKNSDISIDEFFDSSGLSNNYWYKRMRYEAPLNTSDVEHIASTFGLTSLDIYTRALGSEAARAYKARERLPSPSPSSVPACPRPDADDDVAAAIRDHERYGLAANTDGNRDVEAETPDW
jgi:hypothetical protein